MIGLAGLEGSGQRLVLQACAGLLRPQAGRDPRRRQGYDRPALPPLPGCRRAFMPAGRLEEGLDRRHDRHRARGAGRAHCPFWSTGPGVAQKAAERIKRVQHQGPTRHTVEELSGGNQQRTLLALLPPQLKLLLMEHPTRGLDIESTEYIWGLLLERTRSGTAIIFTSSDLDELLDRSDRILVFFGGRVRRRSTRGRPPSSSWAS